VTAIDSRAYDSLTTTAATIEVYLFVMMWLILFEVADKPGNKALPRTLKRKFE
jgi:hypothetical protein